jgi:macrolide transport system ATP-binding/permease protein
VPYSPDDPGELRGLLIACNFFSVYSIARHIGDRPLLGRLMTADDCRESRPVILISEAIWRNRLGADPQIVGKTFHFNQQPLTVIGVLPIPYAGCVNGAQVWMPFTVQPYLKVGNDQVRTEPPPQWLFLAGRLNQGFTRRDAAAELQTIGAQQDALDTGRRTSISVSDGSWLGHPQMRASGMWSIPLIVGALSCVALIACANVATLLLSRAAARQRDVAIRLALGAGRWRLVRMLLCESLLLASIAGLASLYLTYRIPVLIVGNLGPRGPQTELRLDPDWRVFLYLSAVTILAGFLAGLAPALESLRVQLADSLKGRHGRSTSGSGGGRGLRRLLVGTQVALSLVLLVGAAVMARGADRLITAQASAGVEQVVLARLSVPRQPNTQSVTLSSHRAIESRVLSVPGVTSVAWTAAQSFFGKARMELELPGRPVIHAASMVVSHGYFKTMQVPIVRGRQFEDSDSVLNLVTMPVIVTESFARQVWPSEDPLGKVLRLARSNLSVEVVGVAKSTAMDSWGEDEGPLVYSPWQPDRMLHLLVVRSAGDPALLPKALAGAVKLELPTAVVEAKSIPSWLSELTLPLWQIASMIAALGGTALVLTIMGIYGVVAFAVSRRIKEIGIRMAIGARSGDILASVIAGEVKPILIGLAAGLLLALPASVALQKTMERAPFTIDTRDPIAYAIVCGILITVALVAMLGGTTRGGNGIRWWRCGKNKLDWDGSARIGTQWITRESRRSVYRSQSTWSRRHPGLVPLGQTAFWRHKTKSGGCD